MIIGVDLGTTNVRSIIFDIKGQIHGQAYRKLKVYSPAPGIAEESPEEIWKATLETLKESIKTSKLSPDAFRMVSFSSQMHGMLMIAQDGTLLSKLYTWLDRRADTHTEPLSHSIDPYELYSRTGCPLLFSYPLVKILWAKENLPDKYGKCQKFLSAKGYVIFRMLGEYYIDRSLASGTQLLNIHNLEWDERVLEIAGISHDKLPTLVDETEIIGEISSHIAKVTGLNKGIPIIPGGSDGALSNIGLGAVEKGIAALNIGTSGAVRVLSDKPFIDTNHKSQFFCYYAALGNWLSGGAISNAGNILRWYKDKFGQNEIREAKKRGIDSYEVIMEKVAEIKPGAEGLFLLPFYVGERFPIRNSKAKGILFGLTLTHGKAHVARAILEGIVYTLKWIMEILEKHGITIEEVRVGGGGARSSVWRQIQADVLGKPVVHTRVEEASSLGAAMLAAIKLDIYNDLNEASKNMVKATSYHKPNVESHLKHLATFKLFKELYSVSKKFYE